MGWAHGMLFMLYQTALAGVSLARRWRLMRIFVVFVASIAPFGTCVRDGRLRREGSNAGRGGGRCPFSVLKLLRLSTKGQKVKSCLCACYFYHSPEPDRG